MNHGYESTTNDKKTFENIMQPASYLNPRRVPRKRTLTKPSFKTHLARIGKFSWAFGVKAEFRMLKNDSSRA